MRAPSRGAILLQALAQEHAITLNYEDSSVSYIGVVVTICYAFAVVVWYRR